jgi:hypothetical protein
VTGLEVDEDLAHERRAWRAQKAGWGVITVLLTLGAAGLLGEGPANLKTAAAGNQSVRALYERILRHNARSELRATVRSDAIANERALLTVGQEWLSAVKVESIEPPPEAVRAVPGGMQYEFRASGGDFDATFHFLPSGFGPVFVCLEAAGHPPLLLRQFILP